LDGPGRNSTRHGFVAFPTVFAPNQSIYHHHHPGVFFLVVGWFLAIQFAGAIFLFLFFK